MPLAWKVKSTVAVCALAVVGILSSDPWVQGSVIAALVAFPFWLWEQWHGAWLRSFVHFTDPSEDEDTDDGAICGASLEARWHPFRFTMGPRHTYHWALVTCPECLRHKGQTVIVRRTPVSFRQSVKPGETVKILPTVQPPDWYEADRFMVPKNAPPCFALINVDYQAPVSVTVQNVGAETAIFEALMMGNTPDHPPRVLDS